MRIGIDARFLTHPQPGGFKTYTTNLITALNELEDDNDYLLYVDRKPDLGSMLPDSSRFSCRVVSGSLPLAGMPYREQVSLRRQIAEDQPDLVHFLCNTAPVHIQVPYVVTLHDVIQVTTAHGFGRTLQDHKRWAITVYSKQCILRTATAANQVITVSNAERSRIHTSLDIPMERISVTHLAPHPIFKPATRADRECWRRELTKRYDIDAPYVLAVGYEPRKNIPLVLRSFAEIARSRPTLFLVVVAAQEEQRAAFQALAAELGLAQRIRILGALQPHDLMQLYNLAELFVFPSVRESFGLPPIEAMACGAPTMAMNASSIPEIVGDGAHLVSGMDCDHWAAEMGSILDNPVVRADLCERGLRRAATLSWHRCAEKTLSIYRDVAALDRPATIAPAPLLREINLQ